MATAYPSLTLEQRALLMRALTSASGNASVNFPALTAAATSDRPDRTTSESTTRQNMGPFEEPAAVDTVDNVNLNFSADDFNVFDMEFKEREKRKSFDDGDEDDEEEEEGDHKRRDSDDKSSKKPGRKPITTEPTTKRKAQNRAAQRAFRERKEKHLKDLESKVTELEKQSASVSEENGLLRAQIERLQGELKDYKKRISFTGSTPPRYSSSPATSAFNTTGLSDFNFDFPRFGVDSSNSQSTASFSPASSTSYNRHNSNSLSPADHTADAFALSSNAQSSPVNDFTSNSTGSQWTNLFDINTNPYGFAPGVLAGGKPNHYTNKDRPVVESQSSNSSAASPSSESQRCNTHSSCTSPGLIDDFTFTNKSSSPATNNATGNFNSVQPEAALTWPTKVSSLNQKAPASDLNFDWLASQNGGTFDPVLFGDYRESQDAVIGDRDFSSGLFDDSFAFGDPADPFMAFAPERSDNSTASTNAIATDQPTLIDKVDQQKAAAQYDQPADSQRDMWTAHKIWNTLQTCPKFQSGDFDLDGLCSELKTKARCSETGLAVPEDAVKKALWKLAGPAPETVEPSIFDLPKH